MSAKKPRKRASQSTTKAKATHRPETRRNFKVLLAIAIFIVGLILAYITFNVISQKLHNDTEQEKMTTYLEEKYGQKFTVKNLRVTGGGFGVEGRLTADASPVTNPNLVFNIGKPEYSEAANYTQDTFLQILWSQQEYTNISSFMANELGNVSSYTVAIYPGDSLIHSLQGYTPSFTEAQTRYPGQYSYNLYVKSKTIVFEDEPSIEERSRAFSLVELVRNRKGSPISDVSYGNNDFLISTGSRGIKDIQKPEDLSFKVHN